MLGYRATSFRSVHLRLYSDILSGYDGRTNCTISMTHTLTEHKYSVHCEHRVYSHSLRTRSHFERTFYFRTNLFHAPQTFRHHVVVLFFAAALLCGVHGLARNDTENNSLFYFRGGWRMNNTIRSKYTIYIVCRYVPDVPVFCARWKKAFPTCFHHAFYRIYMNSEIFSRSVDFFFISFVLLSCVSSPVEKHQSTPPRRSKREGWKFGVYNNMYIYVIHIIFV